MLTLGLDIGSTTAKAVLMDGDNIIYQTYQRHFSKVRIKALEIIKAIEDIYGNITVNAAISGSSGLGLAQGTGIPFIQEVYSTCQVVKDKEPDTSCVIELGGEDAKIIFFDGGIDERMNGSCAGGTGAFIDQMATLLNVTADELDELSLKSERIYPIASRCGVFAKTDIQPLLNQGARKEDIAASIYQAVVNQTIAGLAQGRMIKGKVLFMGGPLYYCKGLRTRFKETLKLSDNDAVFPEYALYSVSMGASMYARTSGKCYTLSQLRDAVESAVNVSKPVSFLKPLFEDEKEYEEFRERHAKATVKEADVTEYSGDAYLGIDCGSTTTKLVLISENDEILYSYYSSNRGNPVGIVKEELEKIYSLCGEKIKIKGSAVTGYGEELIQNAFGVDFGLVETIAHYTAAKHFMPQVEFILDIGGQDIKCFRIRNGAIDSIMLNEACSSGCGSFLDTFAKALGYSIEEFAKKGLFGKRPVDLGSRCTVFMNSSVKQSQKEGASVEDISAGLSISVVKNAIYKVIRAGSPDELGKHIVVQGGTFYNDAVLRAFEREIGRNVIRTSTAGLMGAFGAALFSKKSESSKIISKEKLSTFVHTAKPAVCGGCQNRCHLTVNTFENGKKFISGNQCEKGAGLSSNGPSLPNLFEFKRNYLSSLKSGENKLGKIGLPLTLGMYELLPLWHTIFTELGFEVTVSKPSTRKTYEKGQFSIPSDTACYPAKIMHGHMVELMEKGMDAIFYPRITYNLPEMGTDNHYNCPVVAYYSDLLRGNMDELKNTRFLYPFLNINNEKELSKELKKYLAPLADIPLKTVKKAVEKGFKAHNEYREAVKKAGEKSISYAKTNGKKIMILAGRPYHIDPEICHGIDKLAISLGFVVVSEDSVYHLAEPQKVNVLNQWSYHSRLYRAAKYASEHSDTELVQLVSFGCGLDAITTDEVRTILERNGKFYTQLKIDEITNLGAVKIRLRSLSGAIEEREKG